MKRKDVKTGEYYKARIPAHKGGSKDDFRRVFVESQCDTVYFNVQLEGREDVIVLHCRNIVERDNG